MSITGMVSGSTGPNPSTAMKLYRSCVLPRALFGCELWNDMTDTVHKKLEVAHHFCLKRAQGLPFTTRSDMVLGLVGATSLHAYIDSQKLLFLGTLCRVPPNEVCYKLYLLRLFQYDICNTTHLGFVSDIHLILDKYDLTAYLATFKTSGVFPSKQIWKTMCYRAVHAREESTWVDRMDASSDFTTFKQCHSHLRQSNIWTVAKLHPFTLSRMKFLANICCKRSPNQPEVCLRCQHPCLQEIEHLLFECPLTDGHRLWNEFYDENHSLSSDLCAMLLCLPRHELITYMLGKIDDKLINVLKVELYPSFLTICADLLTKVYT